MLYAGTEGVCPYTQQRMILDSRNRKSIKTDREKERGLKEIIQIIQRSDVTSPLFDKISQDPSK